MRKGISFGLVSIIFLVISACSTTYPKHWWKDFSNSEKPGWEILPTEAGPGEVILSKRNELGILSNFAHTPFLYRGKRYESVEGFWQMMFYPESKNDPRFLSKKVKWKYSREQVSKMVGFEAKAAGKLGFQNMEKMGIDWVSFEGERFPYQSSIKARHYQLILEVMREKLLQNEEVRNVLLSTGDLILKPDHHTESNVPPEWRYYEIWMDFRTKLKKSEKI